MPADDRQLLLRMRRGDEAAAALLWQRHATRLLAYARAILGRRDPHGAHDIVQQIFLTALRAPRSQATAVLDVPGWLLILTRHAAINHVRSLRREQARLNHVPRPSPSPATVVSHPESTDLTSALDQLPRPMREVVVLKHIAGLTFDQIAESLGANRSTLASRYRAALDLLRTMLADPLPPLPEVSHARA